MIRATSERYNLPALFLCLYQAIHLVTFPDQVDLLESCLQKSIPHFLQGVGISACGVNQHIQCENCPGSRPGAV